MSEMEKFLSPLMYIDRERSVYICMYEERTFRTKLNRRGPTFNSSPADHKKANHWSTTDKSFISALHPD